jgi:hypothetical protein
MGAGTVPTGVIDSNDRVPYGYTGADITGTFGLPATAYGGQPPMVEPNRATQLFVITSIGSNGKHDWNKNNVVTVSYTPRYRIMRGT